MSDDLRQSPGRMPFITDEQARGMARMMEQRAAVDPAFAEDCESVSESMPFLIRDQHPPITCESCGTLVMEVAEEDTRTPPPWTPKRAIWEPATGRKHTLRRCDWLRENR